MNASAFESSGKVYVSGAGHAVPPGTSIRSHLFCSSSNSPAQHTGLASQVAIQPLRVFALLNWKLCSTEVASECPHLISKFPLPVAGMVPDLHLGVFAALVVVAYAVVSGDPSYYPKNNVLTARSATASERMNEESMFAQTVLR